MLSNSSFLYRQVRRWCPPSDDPKHFLKHYDATGQILKVHFPSSFFTTEPDLSVLLFSCILFFVMPWTLTYQTPLSMGFFRILKWVAICTPGDLPDPGIKPLSPPLGKTNKSILVSMSFFLFFNSSVSLLDNSKLLFFFIWKHIVLCSAFFDTNFIFQTF